jgi:diaminopimelate epimerase
MEENGIRVATYERGVEDETLSCGTGVTACALVYALISDTTNQHVKVQTKGGQLEVFWNKTETGFQDIFLVGPATFVFQGSIKRC